MCRSVFQQVYYVPEDAVISLPKAPFEIESGAALGMLLSSKAPDKWLAAMQPESLLMLRGKEGKSVYVLFTVPGHPTEQRFIRHVIASVAEKAFPKLLAELDADPDKAPVNERQRLRRQVLHWRAVDCNGPQIDPKYKPRRVRKTLRGFVASSVASYDPNARISHGAAANRPSRAIVLSVDTENLCRAFFST